ncbi:MAG: polysaccharide biosynthesis tyrosine autokinase [Desulfobacteraceae bacterium]|nr:polysaccharide biosynthesis tyrosine autokinase [Desulfobacteraceae bacterium]
MGKIFDALNKADVETSQNSPIVQNTGGYGEKENKKIVKLKKTNKTLHGKKIDEKIITYFEPQSIESDLFRVLRTNLLFDSGEKRIRTILVTSAMPGDGKSFVSANLSVCIAQGIEEYVLLMDCDIRRPTIHKILGLNQIEGISDYLATDNGLAQYIRNTDIPKLSVIPGGKPPANPTELLTSKKMKSLLDEVVSRYNDRYIIIDSPPPAMASETKAIAKFVDAIIIVVKARKTPRKAVSELIESLGKENVLGIVFNSSDQTVKSYYGYGRTTY